ncbi:hypothetical protein B9Z55_013430 [Caenorhabditis nigoni]|uniref:Uncharacterized protein n=1 Tax=Caenorhabditis nigoni TaxID=1611254 RepID=A0A2G5U2K5_9PELO|nr:hypothetical protein B9Z55_013430 [Caenorhabditis nigoni]
MDHQAIDNLIKERERIQKSIDDFFLAKQATFSIRDNGKPNVEEQKEWQVVYKAFQGTSDKFRIICPIHETVFSKVSYEKHMESTHPDLCSKCLGVISEEKCICFQPNPVGEQPLPETPAAPMPSGSHHPVAPFFDYGPIPLQGQQGHQFDPMNGYGYYPGAPYQGYQAYDGSWFPGGPSG